MKTSLKIAFLFVALAAMTACSAQRRAERHIRKAVALCPELVQVKAHTIDTVLTAPGFADCMFVSLFDVMGGDTLYHATEHGTFIINMDQSNRQIRVGFIAAPRRIRLTDTLHYAHIDFPDGWRQPQATKGTGSGLLWWLFGAAAGMFSCLYMLRNALKNK